MRRPGGRNPGERSSDGHSTGRADGGRGAVRGPLTRGRALRGGVAVTAGLVGAACGATTSGDSGGEGAARAPGGPVELEYWHTNAETTPLEQGRVAALKAAERRTRTCSGSRPPSPGGPA